MKILVTGGAGFIASHIVDSYIQLGHDVIVLDNLSSGKKEFINRKAKFYPADIQDRTEIQKIFQKEKPDVLNHHAAQISVRNSVDDPLEDARINIFGLLNLLEEGKKNKLKKVIFASSGGVVYGEANKLPTPENYVPLQPLSPYGVSKLAGEYYLNFYFQTHKIAYIALRYANVYGPRQNPHGEAGVVAIFCRKLLSRKQPVINGDGMQTRDYIHVSDVCRANIGALKSKFCGSVNIGTAIETNVNQIFSGIENVIKSGIKPLFGPAKKGEQKRGCLDIRLAQRVLKWKPGYNLSGGLENTVAYFKNQVV